MGVVNSIVHKLLKSAIMGLILSLIFLIVLDIPLDKVPLLIVMIALVDIIATTISSVLLFNRS